MEKWKIIIEWANLPLQKQIVTSLAAFILTNLGIIFFFLNRESKSEAEFKAIIKDRDTRFFNYVEYHAKYVDKKETEYQQILLELKKIDKK